MNSNIPLYLPGDPPIPPQPADEYPVNPDDSLSHFITRQLTPEAITNTLPMVVTITAHGLSNGQAIRCTKFITIPLALATGMQQLNNRQFYVQQATTNTFQLYDANAQPIDGRNFTPYISGGQMTVVGEALFTQNPPFHPPPGVPDPFT